MPDERIMVHIICDNVELEESAAKGERLIQNIDRQAAETQATLEQLARDADKLQANIQQQHYAMIAMVRSGFSILRNLTRFAGLSMTMMEQALMTAIETTLASLMSMHLAISLYRAGQLGPAALATEAVSLALSVSASAIMIAAQAQARRDFGVMHQRLQAASNLLEIGSRAL